MMQLESEKVMNMIQSGLVKKLLCMPNELFTIMF